VGQFCGGWVLRRTSKIAFGKIVWSSFKWFLVMDCAWMWNLSIVLTLCRSYLKPYCKGRKTAFFRRAFKFTYYTRNKSPLQEKKIITIKLKKDRIITLFSSYS